MSDGVTIRAALPELSADSDAGDLSEFANGYKIHEITSVEFDLEVSSAPDSSNSDVQKKLDAIEQAARLSGLIYRRKTDRIIVRSAYTC
jgi:hypothetical protein